MSSSKTKPYLYESLALELERDIQTGLYRPGTKVPSVRQLARKFKVSISSVTQAYALLEDRGVLLAKPQSGYYVREHLIDVTIKPSTAPNDSPALVTKLQQINAVIALAQKASSVKLGAAIPALELLPQRAIQLHLQKAARFHSADTLNYQFSPGYMELRALIAQRMRHIAVACHRDDIVITQGCSEALSLSLRCNTQDGDTIAVESPCYYGFLQMAEVLGLKVIEIPSSAQSGISLEALKLALQQWPISLVLLNSRFSNPSSSVMSEQAQRQLVDLANRYDIAVIEDDIYGELDFSDSHNTVLKSFDTEGRVWYCSSFSKTVAPGLRVGWCIPGNEALRKECIRLQTYQSFSVASLPQVAMASYLQEGHYDRHLRKLRQRCKKNVELISKAVREYFPQGTQFSEPDGGFVLWLALPENVSAKELQELALEKNISLIPGGVFSKSEAYSNYIRINCALIWNQEVKNAIEQLGRLTEILHLQ